MYVEHVPTLHTYVTLSLILQKNSKLFISKSAVTETQYSCIFLHKTLILIREPRTDAFIFSEFSCLLHKIIRTISKPLIFEKHYQLFNIFGSILRNAVIQACCYNWSKIFSCTPNLTSFINYKNWEGKGDASSTLVQRLIKNRHILKHPKLFLISN